MVGAARLGIQSGMSRIEKNNQKIIVRPVNGDKSLLMGQSAHCGPQEHGDRGQTRIIDVVQDRAADDETPKREKKSLQGQVVARFPPFRCWKTRRNAIKFSSRARIPSVCVFLNEALNNLPASVSRKS